MTFFSQLLGGRGKQQQTRGILRQFFDAGVLGTYLVGRPDQVGRFVNHQQVPVSITGQFDLLGIILFALMFGAFLITLEGERKKTLVNFVEAVAEVMMKMTGFIISLAPIGIAALIARLVASSGLIVFWEMR